MQIHLETIFERGVNFKERIITITDEIAFPAFDFLDAAMTEMESQSRKTITVKIHSEGGSVYEAMAIVGRIKKSKCKVVTEGYGAVMSAATLILAAGDERRISEFTWFMHHEASYEAGGRHSDMKDLVAQMEKEEKIWSEWMARFSEKDADYWYETGCKKDAYFTAQELIDLGVADEIF
jgi:ATP-dependent Clp protease protease subunit